MTFSIPAAFVLARAALTVEELVYGYRHGWLVDRDVVAIALARLEAGDDVPPAEEELALLLSDDLATVSDLVADLEESGGRQNDGPAVWIFLALAWIHEHRADFLDPLEMIETLYADFDYPEAIEGLVRFMPAVNVEASGYPAIEQRWENFLNGEAARFAGRRRSTGD